MLIRLLPEFSGLAAHTQQGRRRYRDHAADKHSTTACIVSTYTLAAAEARIAFSIFRRVDRGMSALRDSSTCVHHRSDLSSFTACAIHRVQGPAETRVGPRSRLHTPANSDRLCDDLIRSEIYAASSAGVCWRQSMYPSSENIPSGDMSSTLRNITRPASFLFISSRTARHSS